MKRCQSFHQGCWPAFVIDRHRLDFVLRKQEIEIAASACNSNGVSQPGLGARQINRGMNMSIETPGVIKKVYDTHRQTCSIRKGRMVSNSQPVLFGSRT
jgi:hypothetical protein